MKRLSAALCIALSFAAFSPDAFSQAAPEPTYATWQDAKREALRRFPDLGKGGSKFNAEFLSAYHRYEKEDPDFFRDVAWPVRLAEQIDRKLRGVAEVASAAAPEQAPAPERKAPSILTANSFVGLTEEELLKRMGKQPVSIETHPSPDGPFKMLIFDRSKENETFFVIFASDGVVLTACVGGTMSKPGH